jgi:hypothetical protein
MNPGVIKWNVSVSATVDKKLSKKELKEIEKEIKSFNKEGDTFDVKSKGITIRKTKKGTIIKSDFSKNINSPFVLDFSYDGIKSLMKWFPKVLEDRDWDHHYIIDALKFKIQNTCNYIEKKQRHLNWKNDVKYMKLALRLMDKLWPDMFSEVTSYDSEYNAYHVTEHKFVKLSKEEKKKTKEDLGGKMKGSRRMEITEVSERFDEYFAKNKLMHKKAVDYINKNKIFTEPKSKFTRAMVISKLKHEKARKLLFNVLESKIESWWD